MEQIDNIYEVTREDYKAFVERINPGAGKVDENLEEDYQYVKISSKKTGKKWCARRKVKDEPEQYFIFDYPDPDEWGEAKAKYQLKLETKEEVQAVFDAIAELRRQHNDGTI